MVHANGVARSLAWKIGLLQPRNNKIVSKIVKILEIGKNPKNTKFYQKFCKNRKKNPKKQNFIKKYCKNLKNWKKSQKHKMSSNFCKNLKNRKKNPKNTKFHHFFAILSQFSDPEGGRTHLRPPPMYPCGAYVGQARGGGGEWHWSLRGRRS